VLLSMLGLGLVPLLNVAGALAPATRLISLARPCKLWHCVA